MSLPFQDDQMGELAEETTPQNEKVETERQEERDVDVEETVTTQVVEKKTTLDTVILQHCHCVVLMKHSMTICCSYLFI